MRYDKTGERLVFQVRAFPGFPVEQLPEFASEIGAELIVTCTHGRTGLKRALIGSTAEQIVRFARCPVLVLPGVSGPRKHQALERGPHGPFPRSGRELFQCLNGLPIENHSGALRERSVFQLRDDLQNELGLTPLDKVHRALPFELFVVRV